MSTSNLWHFCIDRGGTFTDCIGYSPNGDIKVTKVLSTDDAPILGIRKLLQLEPETPIPECHVKMGTTIGTNALLEHKGAPFALLITKGFGDALEIGTQQRPDIFDIRIKKSQTLYHKIVEIDERISAHGQVELKLNT